jgi:glutathione S-transferase
VVANLSGSRARSARRYFNERTLGVSPYVAGDRFTIADITLHVAMGFGRVVKYRPWDEHANIAAWRERMTARPGLS